MIGAALVLIGSAVLIGANVSWWALRDRSQAARLNGLAARYSVVLRGAGDWMKRASELETENASLRERNKLLVGLVGADAERAALNGAHNGAHVEGWV